MKNLRNKIMAIAKKYKLDPESLDLYSNNIEELTSSTEEEELQFLLPEEVDYEEGWE